MKTNCLWSGEEDRTGRSVCLDYIYKVFSCVCFQDQVQLLEPEVGG